MKVSTIFSTLLLATSTSALPSPAISDKVLQVRDDTTPSAALFSLESRQSCAETCGTVCYYQTTLDNAVADGYSRYKSGQTLDDYPHTYNNYEGFDFPVNGPYQEYPVLKTFKTYTGTSPGADRVIFNTNGQYAGTITHTGALGDDFVACTD